MIKKLRVPIPKHEIAALQVGDMVYVSGNIFCGRDAVLPRICKLIRERRLEGMNLEGAVVFHSAVSPAGVGPTSSNKVEIEESMAVLSAAGVRLHLGKGAIRTDTVERLHEYGAAFGVIPPVTALLGENLRGHRVVLFPELGMEAFYELDVVDYPCVIAAVHGKSIY